ncbi:hypothetical protein [Marinobacterium arenosum]|uniref:hypothetical protein n=1 Tax=Marinobacterium arenosum TaxID=2862496 RepID=UPI001C949058|nr:hypothetical protein [Marinobacterium arenosum]MBY4675273.1 hypothetical protein [Marinobacterium arenosum]
MHNKTLHHIGVGAGFLGLILWYYAGHQLGILDWVAQQVPERYAGGGLMLGIMLLMTPGFFIWKLYNRWLEAKLSVRGRYYEDEYYASLKKDDKDTDDKQS